MNFRKLLQPKLNPFQLFVYSQKDRTISIKTLPSEKISFYKLSQINTNLTYCNSYTDLFISDGNDFWVINHSTYQIRRKKMPVQKRNHSLVFVPSNEHINEGKIFVVGGNDKKTFYFDLKKNYFMNWAQTNELHNNPALIQIGDYLYIFDTVKNNKLIFERTKLTNDKKEWEIIIPNYDQDILVNFPSNNFATSIDSKGNIIFIGGNNINMENNNTYVYDLIQNKIYLSEKGTNDNMNFVDKSFYLIDNQYSVALPEGLEENREIAIVDKKEQSLIKTNIGEIIIQTVRKNKNELAQKNVNDYSISTNENKVNRMKIVQNYDAPKEFGYCVSSYSSEQAKIKAKNDKIKIIEINKTVVSEPKNEAKIKIESEIAQEKEKIQIKPNYVEQKLEEENANQNIEQELPEKQQVEQNIEEKQVEENIEEPNVEQNIEQNVEHIEPMENGEQINEPENVDNVENENIMENQEEEHFERNQEARQEKDEEEVHEPKQEQIPEQKNINIIEYEEINTDIKQNPENINVVQEPEEVNKIKEEQNVEREEDNNEQQEEHYEEQNEIEQQEENEEHIEQTEQKPEEEIEQHEEEQEYNAEQEQIENREEYEHVHEHIENGGENGEENIEQQENINNINEEENAEIKENQEVHNLEEENIPKEENQQEQPQEQQAPEQENIEQNPEVNENIPQEENPNEVDIEKLDKKLDDLIERKMKEEITTFNNIFDKNKEAQNEIPIKKETNIEIIADDDKVHIQMQNELEFNNDQIHTESQNGNNIQINEEEERENENENENEERNVNISGEENVVENEEQMEENNENEYYEGEEGEEANGEEEEHLENEGEVEEMHFGEEDNDNEEENGEYEYNEEQGEERDTFQKTLTQNIGEDVMQIPEQPALLYYEPENFCDYKP